LASINFYTSRIDCNFVEVVVFNVAPKNTFGIEVGHLLERAALDEVGELEVTFSATNDICQLRVKTGRAWRPKTVDPANDTCQTGQNRLVGGSFVLGPML